MTMPRNTHGSLFNFFLQQTDKINQKKMGAPPQGHAHHCGKAAGGRFAQADGNCAEWHYATPSQDRLRGR